MGVTAIIVGASIAAGGSVAASKIGSDATKNAADAQVQGNQAALNFAQQRFNVGQQALAPYQYGGPALAGLGGQVGNQPQGAGNLLAGYSNSVPNARSMALGANPAPISVGSGQTPAASMIGRQNFTNGGMVTVQAPTGETRQMPAAQAQAYVAKGAQIVG